VKNQYISEIPVRLLPKLIILICLVAGLMSCSLVKVEPLSLHDGEPFSSKNPLIDSIRIIQSPGVRPRFSPAGDRFVFDRKNDDGYFDVYISDLDGNILMSLTDNKAGITQRNNGNAVFDSSGKWIIFVSESPSHYLDNVKAIGDPGVGLFSNLFAVDITGSHFWQITNVPMKHNLSDGVPAYAVVNPNFSRDGKTLIWTERYDDQGKPGNQSVDWVKWRIQGGDFLIEDGIPRLDNVRTLFLPSKGNYVTYMGELPSGDWVLAGNMDGQHEYGMDEYRYNPNTKELTNFTNTPLFWEEDASISPNSEIVYMTNKDSAYSYNIGDPDWADQPMQREYYVMSENGTNNERLTYFNDPSAPEYFGRRVIVAASDFSPDGRNLLGTLGIDYGSEQRRNVTLMIALIKFKEPM
jgi:hypothetical protein